MTRRQIQELKKQMKKNRGVIIRIQNKSETFHKAEQKEVNALEEELDQAYAQAA
jgi:hypothetical protein